MDACQKHKLTLLLEAFVGPATVHFTQTPNVPSFLLFQKGKRHTGSLSPRWSACSCTISFVAFRRNRRESCHKNTQFRISFVFHIFPEFLTFLLSRRWWRRWPTWTRRPACPSNCLQKRKLWFLSVSRALHGTFRNIRDKASRVNIIFRVQTNSFEHIHLPS